MSKNIEHQQLKLEARKKIRNIENDIKSEKMEMQSLIDQGRLITVPSPPANESASQATVKQEPKLSIPPKPEKLYVIKVEPQRPTPRAIAIEEKPPTKRVKLEAKTEKKIKIENGDFDPTGSVPPATPTLGRPPKTKKAKELKATQLSKVQNRKLPKCLEPKRRKMHWDYLLDEVKWMATDFYQERKWKIEAAKFFAEACCEELKRRKNCRVDDINWRKRKAAAVSEIIRQWWNSLGALAEYRNILNSKKKEEKKLNLRPLTPETAYDKFDSHKSEIEQLEEDAKTPLHMICDLDKLYPDVKVKRSDLPKILEKELRDADQLKQRIQEMQIIKNIEHNFRFDIELAHYQLQGIKWLINSRTLGLPCHLADEKGLAKRTQIIVYLQNSVGTSLLVVQNQDVFYWLSQLRHNCPDFKYCMHDGNTNILSGVDLVITTYDIASKSEFLLSTRWNSLVFDNVPSSKDIDSRALATLKLIPANHKVAVTHTKPSTSEIVNSNVKNESIVSILLFPDCVVSSRQLGNFTFARTTANVPDKDRPRNTVYKTVKCAMKTRQKTLYEDMLIQSRGDLDSQDLDRVMGAVKRLLRICNHADFRPLPKPRQTCFNRQVAFQPAPSLRTRLSFVNNSRIDLDSQPSALLKLSSRVKKYQPKSFKDVGKNEVPDLENAQRKSPVDQNGPPAKVMKIESIKTEADLDTSQKEDPQEKIVLPNDFFSGQNSIYEDTILCSRITFQDDQSKRKDSLEFSNRLKNHTRSPWALSDTLIGVSSVLPVSDVPLKYKKVQLYPRIFVNNETPNELLAYENAQIQSFCSTKLEHLAAMMKTHQKIKSENNRMKREVGENRRPLKTMICVRSDESADLVRSFFLLKLKVESIYISPYASEEEKNHLIHQFNFSKTIKLLLFNTRAGHLPLPPIGIENIYFYEDEILPAARQIFDEDTVWRINPKERKMVVRMVAKDTVEERICTFSPKIYGQTIQGVHALLTSAVPIEMNANKDRRRASTLPWQLKLCNNEELYIAQKIMNLPVTEERDDYEKMELDTDSISLSETIFSDDEDQILSELTAIEKFAMRQIDYESGRNLERVISPAPSLNNFFDPLEEIHFEKDDLFISSYATEATLVDHKYELIPVWRPPTPPRESNMDNSSHFRTAIWESSYDSKPMALSVSKTRPVLSPLPKAEHELPLSFFHRNPKAIQNHRKQLKNEPKSQLVQTQFSNQPWLIDHEFTLSMAVDDFCRNSTVPVNWDEVASVINSYSSSYHSPLSAKQHYENEIIPREEGKPAIIPGQKIPKVSKKAQLLGVERKAGQKMRSKTAQMYLQDNNSSMSKHVKGIFNDILDVTIKKDERHRDINQVILKPIPKLERNREDKDGNYPDKEGHRSIIMGHGVNPDSCLTPLEIIKKYKHRGLPQEHSTTRSGANPLATPIGTPRTPSSPSSNRPIKNQWHPPGTQPQQMPSHVQVRQKHPPARKRPGAVPEAMGAPGQKIFYQSGIGQVPRYTSPQEVHPRKVSSPRPGHHVQHRAQVPPNQFVIQNGKPIQINTGSSGIQIQSPVNQHPIKTEYVPQVAISGASNQGIQLLKTVGNLKQEPPDTHEQSQNSVVIASTMEQPVNDQPQMIYVQSSDGNKITLKPVTAQGGRQIIQIPQQNTQYISVVNQHGKVIGSQGGPPKLYIKNSNSSGTPHQVVLQPDGSQSLVIPSSMIPQQRLLVQTSTGNIIPQGNKIYIQQANNINQPIILNQGQQIITNNGQILTLQPQQGKASRMFVTQQPQQRVMVQQASRGGNSRAAPPQQVMMANSSKNIVQVQQPIQQPVSQIINPIGGQAIQTTIQPNQPALPVSAETNITLQTTQAPFDRSNSQLASGTSGTLITAPGTPTNFEPPNNVSQSK